MKLNKKKLIIYKMDCIVCFCPIEGKYIQCGSRTCTAKVCDECGSLLCQYSVQVPQIPKCPNSSCNAFYLLPQISKLSEKAVKDYYSATLNFMVNDRGEQVQKDMEQADILVRMRNERKVFLKSHFPPAIAFVAEVALKTKLRRIEKQRAEHVAEQLDQSFRRCMNLFCRGHLSADFKCMVCETEFCKKCEKRAGKDHDGKDHECRSEDVASIDMISSLIHCPKCHIAIQKSDGCNNMTCANCGEHFNYLNGEKGGSGSTNMKVVVREKQKMSIIYSGKLSENELKSLIILEEKEPIVPSQQQISTALKYMYKTGNKNEAAKQIGNFVSKYYSKFYALKDYLRAMSQIEDILQSQDKTALMPTLQKVNARFK